MISRRFSVIKMMDNNEIRFIADAEHTDDRIDAFLASELPDYSRSYIQKLIKSGSCLLNGSQVKAGYRLRDGDEIVLTVPESREPEILPEDIPLDILYEDDDILVVNKPQGMVVHPAAGHFEHTLVNALLYHCKGHLSGINGVMRPGIVHRIDKDTSGVLVVCKSDRAHKALSAQFAVHSITRRYRAICQGNFTSLPDEKIYARGLCHVVCESVPEGREAEKCFRIEGAIGRSPKDRKKMAVVPEENGKRAVTHVSVLQTLNGYSYIECELETGRTHQIRVHLSTIGHPILGDPLYGPSQSPVKGLEGQTLHAMVLGFIHPVSGEYVEFQAPLPDYFSDLLKRFGYTE
jgi:23S rRNA pseudouridine1911/1915/1917 synthase